MEFIQLFKNNLIIFSPELFLLTTTLLLLVYGVLWNTSKILNGNFIINQISWFSVYILIITSLLLMNTTNSLLGPIFNNLLIYDNLSVFTKIILTLATASTLLISIKYIKTEKINNFEYIILILFATTGLLLLISSYDFISLYLAIEFQSLCLYVLASFKRASEYSTEAGLKYFVLGAFSSGLLLFGISLLYGFTGLTNFEELHTLFTSVTTTSLGYSNSVVVAIIFIFAGLLFKATAAPFHMWSPDVYEGSPTSVTAFFAIVPKIAIFTVLLRISSYIFYDLIHGWQHIFIVCGLLSILVGTLGAFAQKKIKRLLAYSGISHVGFMLLALSTGTIEGIKSLFIYLIIYILMSINVFSILLNINKSKTYERFQYLNDLNTLFKTQPILAFALTLNLLSMAGIPPLAGFFSKMYVFFSTISISMFFASTVAVFLSVLGCFYYIRLIKIMYFEKFENYTFYMPITQINALFISITLFFILFFFLYPTLILNYTHYIALMFQF